MSVRERGEFYDYQFWVDGRLYTGTFNGKNGRPIAKDKKDARDLEAFERRKALNGTYDQATDREELRSFAAFVDKVYLPFARKHHSGYAHDEFRTGVFKEFFAGKRFDDITMMSVIKYVNERLDSITVRREVLGNGQKTSRKRSPTTVNKEVTLLSSIFRMAIKEKVASANPCDDLPRTVRAKIPARRRRLRYLSWDEEQRLFATGLIGRREHLRPIVRLALWTGMRRGELLRLKREHVNLGSITTAFIVNGERVEVKPNWLLIEKTKNGKPRLIPLSKPVRSILEVLCSDATSAEFVFPNPRTKSHVTDVKKAFSKACEDAGVENLTFHDLRHTWSTRAAECGVTETVRRDILGHSASTITGDYTHSTPEAQVAAMESVTRYEALRIRNLDKILTNASTGS